MDAPPLGTTPFEELNQREQIETTQRLMDSLPELWRSILQLRNVEGKRYDEIAQILSISESQVKVYLHRARTRLRQQMNEVENYGL